MAEPPHTPPRSSRLDKARGLVRGARNAWFLLLACLVGVGGLVLAAASLTLLAEGELFGLVTLALSAVPISLPLVVFRERRRDRRLADFLIANLERLEEGVTGPGGALYTLDTTLVSYRAIFSAVVVSLTFESGLYPHGSGHRLPKTLYTLFTVLFGWWTANWGVWGQNLTLIAENLDDDHQITVRQLLGLDVPVAEEGAAAAEPGRLPA